MTEILETPKLVTVFGGSGFVGRHLVRALAKRGYRIRVACRRPDLAGHLQPLGNVGQIQAVQANLCVRWSVDRAVEEADHVVNLVGILHESGRQTFNAVQDFGARAVAEAARANNIGLTHLSAIGADAHSESGYARSKALGEKAALETVKDAVIFRPSIVFGPEDAFFNRFADMARYSPVLPLIGGGATKFQPVFVGDVAECFVRSIESRDTFGKAYDLVGPQVYTLRELVDYVNGLCGNRCRIIALGEFWSLMQAGILSLLPKPPLTPDNLRSMELDSVRAGAVMPFGLTPTPLEAVAPSYILGRAPRVHYDRMRVRAGR